MTDTPILPIIKDKSCFILDLRRVLSSLLLLHTIYSPIMFDAREWTHLTKISFHLYYIIILLNYILALYMFWQAIPITITK